MSKRRKYFIWCDYNYGQKGLVLAFSKEDALNVLRKEMPFLGLRVAVWAFSESEMGQFLKKKGILVAYQSDSVPSRWRV